MAVQHQSRRWRARVALVACAAVALGACADGGSDGGPEGGTGTTDASAPAPDRPRGARGAPAEVTAAANDWPVAGRDYDNSRATTSATITAANVTGLAPRWRTTLEGAGSLSTAPLVLGATVYLQGGSGPVFALDRATGALRWSSTTGGFNIGPFGVAVGEGQVYALDGSRSVLALDAVTGAQRWTTRITTNDTEGVDLQPLVFGGLVLASSVPVSIDGIYAGGDRGVIHALDAKTGEVRWRFDTVRSADLWGNPAVNSGGGAWYPPAVDGQRRVVYFGVANPAPFPGTAEFPNGSSRPGANLYTNSIVALDVDTGARRWHHQVAPHDIFDRDQVHALIARPDGGDEVIVSAGKGGVIVGLTPDGDVRWETEVGEHENDGLEALPGPTQVLPGTYGGILTPPATADGVVYAAVVNAPVELRPDATAYFGAELGQRDGEVVAVDARDGAIRWATKVPGDPLGGATVVNDLVLTALLDGTIVALDRRRGDIVWQYALGGTINGWMSVVGDQILVPVVDDGAALVSLALPVR